MHHDDKQNCYFLLSRPPYPPLGGDKVKSYQFLKILNAHFNLYVIIVTDEAVSSEAKDFLKNNTKGYHIFEKSTLVCYWSAFKQLFTGNSFQVKYYYFKSIHNQIKSIIKPNSVIVCNLIRMAEYTNGIKALKILDIVDSIYLNYQRSVKQTSSIIWRLIYKLEVLRVCQSELNYIKHFDATLFVNEYEAKYYKQLGKTFWIPNGVNDQIYRLSKEPVDRNYQDCIVFFGKMDYQPNIDAVNWLIDNVVSKLSQIKLLIIGINSDKIKKRLKHFSNIEVYGYVENPYNILHNCLAMVAPMQTGGGIQNKILEAMASGSVVIASSLGANAIKFAIPNKHLLVADEPENFVDIIQNIKNAKVKTQKIKEDAKWLIQHHYTWENYSKKFSEAYKVAYHLHDEHLTTNF